MASKNVDAIFGLKDHFSRKMQKIIDSMDKSKKAMRDASYRIQAEGRKIKSAGDMMTKAFTLPIMAAGAFSVSAFKDVKAGTDNIIKATGATGDQLTQFRDVMKDVSGTVASSFDNIGSTLGEVNTRFNYTGDTLKNATVDFEQFAKVTGLEGAQSVQLVSRAMGDAGIAADQYGKVLDQLTVAGQASGIAVDQLATNMTKYGAPMRALGFEMEESIALFSSWEKAGVNTEIAFSGMKKAISNWGKEGKDARVEFKQTLDEIKAAPDIAAATSMAIEAFGAKAGPDLADAIQNGRFEYEEMLNIIQSSEGAVSSAYNDMIGPVEKFQMAMNKLKGPASEFGSAIMDTVMPTFERLAGKLQAVADWFGNLSDTQKKAVVSIAMVVAAVGPLTSLVGRATIGIGKNLKTVISLFKVLNGGFGGFANIGKMFMAVPLPVLAVIAVIALLVAAFKHLWDTNEEFRAAITATWNKIKDTVTNFITQMKTRLEGSGIKESFAKIIKSVTKIWDVFCEFLAPVFVGVFAYLADYLEMILNVFIGIVDIFTGIFTGDWSKVWQGIKTIFSAVWKQIKGVLNNYLNWFKQTFPKMYTVAKGVVDKIKSIINALKTVFNGITTFISGTFSGNWRKAWQGVKDIFSGIVSGLTAVFKTPINGVIKILNSAIDEINKLDFSVPDWIPLIGGKSWDINIPKLNELYTGTSYWQGGPAIINDRGGEIVDLPRGSRVYPHDASIAMARREGGTTINVSIGNLAETVVVREEADIEKIAQQFASEIRKIVVNRGEVAYV